MTNIIIIVVAIAVFSLLSFTPVIRQSSTWKATATPLASIMGSGFLVCAPLLANTVGNLAVFCMAGLLLLAFLVGSTMRFNIRYFEPIEHDTGVTRHLSLLSEATLVGAYFISVSYYLQLFSVFLLNSVDIQNGLYARLITTIVLSMIAFIAIFRGLSMLENVEKYTVNFNLGMISALILALILYNIELFTHGQWQLASLSSEIDFYDVRVLLGLLIVVQGFETSRFLGAEHSPEERIRTMRFAQLISSVIYLLFLSFMTPLFHDGYGADVTAITQMVAPVATILPILIACAALASQFSAAVADNEGGAGLLVEASNRKISMRVAYVGLWGVSVLLTWITDVNQIIAFASRAFALFYALQCLLAYMVCRKYQQEEHKSIGYPSLYIVLSIVMFLVFVLGVSSE